MPSLQLARAEAGLHYTPRRWAVKNDGRTICHGKPVPMWTAPGWATTTITPNIDIIFVWYTLVPISQLVIHNTT
jgi:hypothetical protein